MKYFYSFFILVLICIGAIAQPLPIMRNAMSTNVAGTPVLSQNDLSVTNVGSGTNWLFYGILTQTVARLGDVWGSTGSVSLITVSNVVSGYGSNLFILKYNGIGTNTTFDPSNLYTFAAYVNGPLVISNELKTNFTGLIIVGTNAGFAADGGNGDANGSGTLSAADITLMRNWINQDPISDTLLTNIANRAMADIDGDGFIDLKDIQIARKVVLGVTNIIDLRHQMQRLKSGTWGFNTNRFVMVGTKEMVDAGREDIAAKLEIINTNHLYADFIVNTNEFAISNKFGFLNGSMTFSNEPDGNTFGAIFTGTNGGIYVEGGGGDINGSGTVTIADQTAILNWVTLATGSDTYLTNAAARARADIDGNGFIDFNDWILAGYAQGGATDIPTLRRNFQRKLGGIYGVDYTNEMFIVGTRQLAVGSRPYGMAKLEILNTNRAFSDFMVNTNEFVVSNHLTTANGSVDIYTNLLVRGSNHVTGQAYFGNTVYVDGPGSGLEVDAITITNATTNLGAFYIKDNAISNALLRCTNSTTGQATWDNNYLNSTEVSNLVSSVAYGQTWFVWGSSNTLATNAAGTPYKAMLKGDTPLPATANTNTYTTPTAGQYVGEVITAIPAGISLIVPGDIVTESFAYLSENRTMVLQPEIYIRTNMIAPSFSALGEREVAVGPSFTVNNTFQSFAVNIPVTTNIVLSSTNYLVRKLRVVSVSGGTPNLLLVSQDGYPARVTFPIASSSFVLKSGDTMLGTLVLTNSYNVGTAFSSRGTNNGSEQFGSNAIALAESLAIGDSALANSNKAVAVGRIARADALGSIAIGYNSQSLSNDDISIGSGASAQKALGIAMGSGALAQGVGAISIGYSSQSTFSEAVALGSLASAYQTGAVALGSATLSQGSNSVAIGYGANSSYTNSSAIGTYSTTTTNNQVMLGRSVDNVNIPGGLELPVGAAVGSLWQCTNATTGRGQWNATQYKSVWIDAGAMATNATGGPTVGYYTATNYDGIYSDVWDYDSLTPQTNYFKLMMPDSWDLGTVKVKFYYFTTAVAASTSNVWAVCAQAINPGDLFGFRGTEVQVTNLVQDTTNKLNMCISPAITVGGTPTLGNMVHFQIRRVADSGWDNSAGNARLLGVAIQWNDKRSNPTIW